MRLIQVLSVIGVMTLAVAGVGCSPGAPAPSNSSEVTVPPPPPPVPPTPAVDPAPQMPTPDPIASSTSAQSPATPTPPAVAPVKEEPANLIANGSFVTWDEGQHVPRHWTMGHGYPLEEMPFKLERIEDPTYDDGYAVRQTWLESDATMAFQRVFGQTIEGLEPNTGYRLDVVAHNESKNVVIISAFEMEDYETGYVGSGEAAERLNLEAATITPSTGLVTYTGSFITNDSGTVKLGARVRDEDPDLPCSVIWDSWTLRAVD